MIISITDEQVLPQLVIIEALGQLAPWPFDVFKRCLLAGYAFLGWVNEDQVIGFIIYSFSVGECHILNLCVHPDYQGLGVGKNLLVHALTVAHETGAEIAFLEVRCSNHRAIALYQAMGFNQIGERKGYYPRGEGREDALVFAKDLSVT